MSAQARMIRPVLLYGLLLAAFAFLLDWLDYRRLVRDWPVEFYVVVVAILFAGLGIWLGRFVARPRPRLAFERNEKALAYLGISPRECEVLDLLAEGCPNKVIARRLAISPNTVKTHISKVFEKLEVASRTQAIARARELHLLP